MSTSTFLWYLNNKTYPRVSNPCSLIPGVASGAASGAGTGSFAGFPSFPFPSPPLAPLPYFNQGFPFFQPFPFFDFNAYNLQLQNWIKASELQAQQAAAK